MRLRAHGRRRVHAILFLIWAAPGAALSWLLRNSVPWVVFMSWWAIVATHAAGWSAETPVEEEH